MKLSMNHVKSGPGGIYFYIFFLTVILLGIFQLRGIFYPDEGYILNTASRILQGQILYKDFQFVYTPLTPFVAISFFRIFGESIFVARIAAISISIIAVFSLVWMGNKVSNKIKLALIPFLIYISWGPTHINFLWPSMTALSMGFASLAFLVRAIKSENSLWYFLSGFFAFAVFLSKPNLGLAVVLSILVSLLLFKARKNVIAFRNIGIGVGLGVLIFLLFLQASDSIVGFWENFYVNIIEKILIEKTISTPLIYQDDLISYLKFVFYISPILVGFYAVFLTLKRRTALVAFPLFSIFFTLFGIRPVTDYVHVAPLIATTGLSIIVILVYEKSRAIALVTWLFCVVLILSGFYTAWFFNYYRWEEPLNRNTIYINQRIGVWVTPRYAKEIPEITSLIQRKTHKNEPVFINYYAPMIYFFANRPNATSLDYISSTAVTKNQQQQAVNDLTQKKVNLIMTHELADDRESVIGKYIYKNFIQVKKIGGIIFWERKL